MPKLIVGQNDLLSCNPELAKEYDKEKNIEPIENIFAQSNKEFWWKCSKCGYSWEQDVYHRNHLKNDGTFKKGYYQLINSCPKCSRNNNTSFPEQAIYFYIKKYFKDAINSYRNKKILNKFELDIFIPSLRVAIEYDGSVWHQDKNKDLDKSVLCKKNNIKLIRIREKGCPKLEDNSIKITVDNKYMSSLESTIKKILLTLNIEKFNININRDTQKIQKQYKNQKIERSIASNKKLLREFSSRNLILPENIALNSNDKYWWVCPYGHEYKASPGHRNRGRGCPYCANRKVLKGFNDLATKNLKLAKEWNYEKNNELNPTLVSVGSSKKVWWKCQKGHEWEAIIFDRKKGNGCPYCAGQKILIGYNDLATKNPELVKEWHPTKNGNLKPENFFSNSSKKVWWKCNKCGYEWEAVIHNRAKEKGTNCPKCKGLKMNKKISQYDLNGIFIRNFDSITNATSFFTNKRSSNISTAISGKTKTAYGYIWKYAEEE